MGLTNTPRCSPHPYDHPADADNRSDSDEASPAQIDLAIRRAKSQAARFVAKLPVWMDHDAFFGEALLAVALAARDYDPRHGSAFQSWAHNKVRFALLEEQRRQDPVGRVRRSRISRGELTEEPTDLLPLSFEQLQADRAERLDRDLRGHAPSAEELTLKGLDHEALRAAVATLPDREAEIIELRFFDTLSRTAIARRLRISETRVKQLEASALERLRLLLSPEDA